MANPVCGTNCEANLPEVAFDRCNPEVRLSEIRRIFIAKVSADDFIDVSDPTEWATRLSQSANVTGNEIRTLTVIADKPAPALTEKDISGGRKISINKAHLINFTIDEVTAENHEFVRLLECGSEFKIWYETAGDLMFGGNSGIIARLKADMVLARGDENMVYNGTAEWKNRFTEERTISPIAA